jgi:peptidoglycan/LPS O-acetylase OafA/YrhL
MPAPSPARHYGVDWLRIGAFGLLIGYHVAMVFSPWAWVVKWPQTFPSLIAPMALLTPWRLPLLFAVSGFATRHLLRPGFVAQRSARLLVPLGCALIALLPPEMWVRAREAGYAGSLARFWLVDGWNPTPVGRMGFPAWEHLWFVVYLWTYTMLLAVAPDPATWQRGVERWLAGRRLVWLPVAVLGVARLTLMFLVPERHDLTGDWEGHALYLPMFLFGVALGGSPALWHTIRRSGATAALVAAAAGLIVVTVERLYPGTSVPPHAIAAAERFAQVAMAWGMTIALLAAADRWGRRDHPWRARLAAAVFPAYLVHHPVIVVTAWLLRPSGVGAGAAAVAILAATVAACVAAAWLARSVPWLAPVLGGPMPRRGGAPVVA